MGVEAALKDAYHRPKQPRITAKAKAWVVHLACRKPKELGYAAVYFASPPSEKSGLIVPPEDTGVRFS